MTDRLKAVTGALNNRIKITVEKCIKNKDKQIEGRLNVAQFSRNVPGR
jgi:hypothetical protein